MNADDAFFDELAMHWSLEAAFRSHFETCQEALSLDNLPRSYESLYILQRLDKTALSQVALSGDGSGGHTVPALAMMKTHAKAG